MDYKLPEVVKWMLDHKYLLCVKGKYKVTEKFNKEVVGTSTGLIELGGSLMVRNPVLGPVSSNWDQRYMQFIIDAEVPKTWTTSNNHTYDLNKFSVDGAKAFRHAIEKEGCVYEILTKSTMLYYKRDMDYKKIIGNYMSEKLYKTDYNDMVIAAATSEETLIDHITKTMDNEGSASRFTMG
jgi:hypothetical protein